MIARTIEKNGIPPSMLELEITESIFMRDLERVNAALAELRELGVTCAIDDFGTGFSGLSYLADMPIDNLKIDESFVSRLDMQSEAPIIEAIIGLGRGLGLNIIAEGVESANQAASSSRMAVRGCRVTSSAHRCPQPRCRCSSSATTSERSIGPLVSATQQVRSDALQVPQGSSASRILASICGGGGAVSVDDDELTVMLAALVPAEPRTRCHRRCEVRPCALPSGHSAAWSPLSGGYRGGRRAAGSPVQNAVAQAFNGAGIDLQTGDSPDPERWLPALMTHLTMAPLILRVHLPTPRSRDVGGAREITGRDARTSENSGGGRFVGGGSRGADGQPGGRPSGATDPSEPRGKGPGNTAGKSSPVVNEPVHEKPVAKKPSRASRSVRSRSRRSRSRRSRSRRSRSRRSRSRRSRSRRSRSALTKGQRTSSRRLTDGSWIRERLKSSIPLPGSTQRRQGRVRHDEDGEDDAHDFPKLAYCPLRRREVVRADRRR